MEKTMSFFESKTGKSVNVEKEPFPEEYQMQLVMNQYQPKELEEMQEKFILKANHWNLFGNSFRYYEKYEEAENAYLQSVELDPNNEEPYGNLLSLYIQTDNYENYENVYQKGTKNANPQDFIIYQDGRYQYHQGDYDMAFSAALSVLTSKQMQDEGAWILGVRALMGMGDNERDKEKSLEHYSQAIDMLKKGLFVFPESKGLKQLKEMIGNNE
jgi:tetratricopeptide (TPR) repeat protein